MHTLLDYDHHDIALPIPQKNIDHILNLSDVLQRTLAYSSGNFPLTSWPWNLRIFSKDFLCKPFHHSLLSNLQCSSVLYSWLLLKERWDYWPLPTILGKICFIYNMPKTMWFRICFGNYKLFYKISLNLFLLLILGLLLDSLVSPDRLFKEMKLLIIYWSPSLPQPLVDH